MIKTDAKSLTAEIEAAERLRDNVLKASETIRQVYRSQYFRSGEATGERSPLNMPFDYLATVTPAIVFDNPRVSVRSTASGTDKSVTKMLQHALNQWAKVDTIWQDLHRVWFDEAFSFGVVHTYLTAKTGPDGEDYFKVCARRVPPEDFLVGVRSEHWTELEWSGQAMRRDKEELLQNDLYFKDVVQALPTDQDKSKANGQAGNDLNRGEVTIYEIWVPTAQAPNMDPNLYHGMIYELANGQFVRAPRPFFGPEWGPYVVFGAYTVPKEVFPLSPLGAQWDQVVEYNAHANAASKSASRHKKILAIDSAGEASANRIRASADGDVVMVDGLANRQIQNMEFGGTSPTQTEYLDRKRNDLNLAYGLSDASRGVATGKGTATEAADAAGQRDARTDFIAKQFTTCTSDVLYTVAWYMWNSEFVKMKLSPEAALEMNPRPQMLPPEDEAESIAYAKGLPVEDVRAQLTWEPQAVFQGGAELHGGMMDFDDLMLEIEPMSMARTNEPLLQKRAGEFIGLLAKVAPIIPQTPHIKWDKVLENYGEAFNQGNMSEFIDMQELRRAREAQQAAQKQADQAAQQQAQQAQLGNQVAQAPLGGGAGVELPGNVTGQAQSAAQGVA
jgi:hypothetical protein